MSMTVQQIRKKKKKPVSQTLQDALDAIPSPEFEKLQTKVDRVFEIGRAEGFTDKQIGKLVRMKMKEHYSQRTIQNVFEQYPDAKQKQIHRKVAKGATSDEADKNSETSKFRNFKEIIAAKIKLIKEKDEEIKRLKQQLASANKRIKELESKVREKRPEDGDAADIEKRKLDIGAKLRAHQLKRLERAAGAGPGGEQES